MWFHCLSGSYTGKIVEVFRKSAPPAGRPICRGAISKSPEPQRGGLFVAEPCKNLFCPSEALFLERYKYFTMPMGYLLLALQKQAAPLGLKGFRLTTLQTGRPAGAQEIWTGPATNRPPRWGSRDLDWP